MGFAVLNAAGKPTSYRPMRPVAKRMITELLGAAHEITFIDVILRDAGRDGVSAAEVETRVRALTLSVKAAYAGYIAP
jgi:hypothetical protein